MSYQQPEDLNAALVAEADAENDDQDSALGIGTVGSSSTSILSSVVKYRQENNRTYHAYKDGAYLIPNDESENERLDLQHAMFGLTFDGKLCLAPIEKGKKLHRVLDAGTGTGIWAMDFADEHPECQVTGVDLSPIQPKFVPPNVTFYVDDLEDTWTYSQKFDFIYCRMMTGSIADWPKLFRQSFENINPGGYIELSDTVFPVQCDDGTMPEDSATLKWTNIGLEGMKSYGRPINSALQYKTLMEAAGFVDVKEIRYKWPSNRWPRDPKYKELGMWNLENFSRGLSGFSLALFTRPKDAGGLGWSVEEMEVFLTGVRKELRDTSMHMYFPLYVVYGRKPVES